MSTRTCPAINVDGMNLTGLVIVQGPPMSGKTAFLDYVSTSLSEVADIRVLCPYNTRSVVVLDELRKVITAEGKPCVVLLDDIEWTVMRSKDDWGPRVSLKVVELLKTLQVDTASLIIATTGGPPSLKVEEAIDVLIKLKTATQVTLVKSRYDKLPFSCVLDDGTNSAQGERK